MLTQEDDVEIHALAARGWSVSAISRHTGRDRKTIRRYLAARAPANGANELRAVWSRFAPTFRRGSSTTRGRRAEGQVVR
jgi:transposase